MISLSAIAAMILTLVIGIIVPTLFCIVLCAKKKFSFRMVLMGMAAAECTRIIIASGVLNPLYNLLELGVNSESLITSAIIGACTVALVSELSRFIFAKFTLGKGTTFPFENALAFGFGFGVMGNIVSIGTMAVGNLTLALSINTGTGVFTDYAASVGQETATQVLNSFLAVPPHQFSAGAVQCIMMLIIEAAFSILMIYSIRTHKKLGIAAVFGAHFLLNFGTGLMAPHGVWAGELYIAIFMVALCAASFEIIKKYREQCKPAVTADLALEATEEISEEIPEEISEEAPEDMGEEAPEETGASNENINNSVI